MCMRAIQLVFGFPGRQSVGRPFGQPACWKPEHQVYMHMLASWSLCFQALACSCILVGVVGAEKIHHHWTMASLISQMQKLSLS